MAVSLISPNPDNYFIGRGILWWKNTGAGSTTWRDLGNAPVVQFKPAIKNLDHFSSRQGIKNKDKSVPIEANATVVMQLEEWTRDNLALAMMGPEGVSPFDILIESTVTGGIFLLGTNSIGARMAMNLPIVNLTPTGTFDFIGTSDKFGTLEITGDVLADPVTGSFGTLDWNTALTAPP